ncbi:MAG: sigma-54-dependent transcriptional regulator [Gemmataceae bacterium]
MPKDTTEPLRVLVIDDNPSHANLVAEGLERVGYVCTVANSGTQGAKKIEDESFDVILTDLRMAGVDGLGIVRKAKQEQPDAEVVVITGFGDVHTAVEAIKLGAAHYLMKPVDLAELRAIVDKSAERLKLAKANRELRQQLDERFGFEGVIGNSPKMQQVIARLKAYAATNATVLILGESGTGKELVAKALHTNSPRKNKPFVAMNCTAFNENLLDDELFGHEAGAFTGADKMRKGRFEHANGGTLFLDEVGDMPLPLQAKLLRVLENGEVIRIGSNEPVKVDVRLISATHRDLEAMIAEGKFRQDLYHRLKVGTIRLPPLRERGTLDIALLAEHFLKELNQRHGKRAVLSPDLLQAFKDYSWPGNVRELRNVLESTVVQDYDGELTLDDVEEGEPLQKLAGVPAGRSGADALVGRPLSEVERYYMQRALELTGGNREEAAKMLGIGERTLYRVIQDWKLQDRIKQVLAEEGGDHTKAAAKLNMKPDALERKLKKLGSRSDEE